MALRYLLPLALVLLTNAAARGNELWRIGEFDNSYDEFACARDYGAYARTFPKDVEYRVGTSTPRTGWSFVQPGPTDPWAGSRMHPFAIIFSLPERPSGMLRLVIDLVDVQRPVPGGMQIEVNGTQGEFALPNGGGDASLTDPRIGKEHVISVVLPGWLFRGGGNRIVLRSTGSWVLYDAVSLSTVEGPGEPPGVRSLTVTATPFLKRADGGALRQAVWLQVETSGLPERLALTAELGGKVVQKESLARKTAFGAFRHELLVPEISRPAELLVRVTGGETTAEARTTLEPARRWHVFVAPAAHTDIGYTGLQRVCEERHNANTRSAIELCRKYPAFAWNLEVSWQGDVFTRDEGEAAAAPLWDLARKGRVGVQAGYLNMLTGLCSHEELNRWLYYAASLNREHGVPFNVALTTDVPTQVWSLPTTLAAAGIRYYANGINNERGYPFNRLETGHPYWWEGPDGSRVLTYFAPGYAHAGGPMSSVTAFQDWVVAAMQGAKDSPYDALFLYGAFSDNQGIDERCAATAQEWESQYEYPKLHVGPYVDYLRYMDQHYGDKLPVVRGDPGVYWEDGAASSAWETTLNRRAHETASLADATHALAQAAGGTAAPKPRLTELWRNILLYDEHTWGAWNSISSPDDPNVKAQWEVKGGFARQADRAGRDLSQKGIEALASLISTDRQSVVFLNATSWDRERCVVEADVPPSVVPAAPGTARPLPCVRIARTAEGQRLLVRVPRIPAWGYTVCPLVPGEPAEPVRRSVSAAAVLDNGRLRVTFAPDRGSVRQVTDLATGRGLVEYGPDLPGLNEYLYVAGGDGTNMVTLVGKPADLRINRPTGATFEQVTLPGLGQRMVVRGKCEKTPSLESTYTLWDGSAALEIDNRVERTEERHKEAAYFSFPFAVSRPEIRLEIPNGVARAGLDQLPGGCTEWFAVQHWARVAGADGGVVWSSPDAPLVCVGDINRGKWPSSFTPTNGRLYSYAMNNYWHTNYKASQSGALEFRYALTAEGAEGDAAAARFGWQASMPVRSVVVPGPRRGPLAPDSESLCRVSPSSVIVTAVKAAEAGSGVVVRLFSLQDGPIRAEVHLGGLAFRKAELTDLVERPVRPLSVLNNTVTVPLEPLRPVTVVFR